jgi:hypothetical protein
MQIITLLTIAAMRTFGPMVKQIPTDKGMLLGATFTISTIFAFKFEIVLAEIFKC